MYLHVKLLTKFFLWIILIVTMFLPYRLKKILKKGRYTGNFQEDVEEKLVAELARLTTLLTIYEDKEEYEKAAVIQKKINRINNQLNNL